MLKDILLYAAYANAVEKLTRTMKKNGLDAQSAREIVEAVMAKHFPPKDGK